ncbi:MAG: rod shape-determining protein RodA [Chloroflexi bacterium]|nr:rod shape-determining protein RodA [Chloroflexota bacterium]
MKQSSGFWRQFDYLLFLFTVLLIIIGILMIRSATLGAIDPELIRRLPDQINYALIGIVLVFVLAAVDYRLLGGVHNWLYLAMVFLLLLVLLFGVEGDGGARSWINFGIRIQPAEIAKIIIIITLGVFFAQNYQQLDKLSTIVKSLVHLAVPTLLIFVQPDLGMAIVFLVLWFTMIWGAGLRLKHLGLFVLMGLLALPILWDRMELYQRERITSFIALSPDDPSYYNILQAQITIGNGGWIGRGYAQGPQSQLRFLRVRHTDFIFAVIAEEFGFVGGAVVIVLIGGVLWRVAIAARSAADPLGSMICYGVASFIFFQTVVSIGMNLRLLPVTGLTLPFISSGGTSLLSTLAGIGLVQSVIVRRRRLT